jgi:hypothetical protein
VGVVGASRREDVDVLHRFVSDRLDVVLDTGRNEQYGPRPDVIRFVPDVVDGSASHDSSRSGRVVTVRADGHPRLTVVHHQHEVVGPERATANARPDRFVKNDRGGEHRADRRGLGDGVDRSQASLAQLPSRGSRRSHV